jgi:hypothetical protein
MIVTKKMLERINQLIKLGDRTLKTESNSRPGGAGHVDGGLFHEFRTSCLSFILNAYGEKHPYYVHFFQVVYKAAPFCIKNGMGIMTSIKTEVKNGWFNSLRGIVSAEIFSDFLEMSQHLIAEQYKDPAAVIIGSVLEKHLTNLCVKNGIDISSKDAKGKILFKKASVKNDDLAKKGVYNLLEQKTITAWLDLRNKAAHGKYSEYDLTQVKHMQQGITDFIVRNPI